MSIFFPGTKRALVLGILGLVSIRTGARDTGQASEAGRDAGQAESQKARSDEPSKGTPRPVERWE